MNVTLDDLGFDDWFRRRLDDDPPRPGLIPCRVTAVNRNNYHIRGETSEVVAEAAGRLLYEAQSRADLPVTGDWVLAEVFDGGPAILHAVLPRKSLLRRKTAGLEVEHQPIAANIDLAFVVQSLEGDYNPRRLERYLTIVNQSRIRPVVLFSKTDLVGAREAAEKTAATRETNPGVEVIAFSNETGDGIGRVRELVRAGQTCCLLGSSGAGKTTLLNRLIGRDVFATGAVREKDGKGRHVTTRRQLTVIESGGLVVDTPGMRELGAIGVQGGLEDTFGDIVSAARNCRFRDCTHTREPGCAVREAIERGEIPEERYRSYAKLQKESQHHEMSLVDRRRKDRQFGKMVKQFKKHKGKR